MELLKRINDAKANAGDLDNLVTSIDDIYSKIKHISVYNQELAQLMNPSKEAGKFGKQEDLNESLKKRE
jgi:tetrahydromethanopterin S-methyltransferase subunit B